MRRAFFFVYGLVAYGLFLVTFLYAVGFVANLMVPKAIDTGAAGPLGPALLLDAALLTLFAVQHSGMARPAFKRWWTRFIPQQIERSTYVLAASAVLLLLFALWQPMPQRVWDVRDRPTLAAALWAMCALGWLTVLGSTFLLGHARLFGVEQVWSNLRRRIPVPDRFRTPALYAVVRHPLMLGFLVAFWATPVMTVGHLFFAVATTGYILIAVRLEERDLVAYFGQQYREYQQRVPAFLPLPFGRLMRPRERQSPARTEAPLP
jgi:methanethiol S-methyltransferase